MNLFEKTNINTVNEFYQLLSSGTSLPVPTKISPFDGLIRWSGKGEYSTDKKNAQKAYSSLPAALRKSGFKSIKDYSIKSVAGPKKYITHYEHPNLKNSNNLLVVEMSNDEEKQIYIVDLYYQGDTEELINAMNIKKESYSWDLKEAKDELNLDKAFWVIFFSGQIGGPKGKNIYSAKGLKGTISATFDDKATASQYASARNKTLSPGEKSYYKMKYSVVPGELKNILKEEKVDKVANLYVALFKDSDVKAPTTIVDRKHIRWTSNAAERALKEIDRVLRSKGFKGSGESKASKESDSIKRTTETYFHPKILAWGSVIVTVSKNTETGNIQLDVTTLGNPDVIKDAIK